ncbi:MAG: VCBS repeat-containing protein [Anaerolineae bacterium]|nr:VCBS repeat-containing protein [Anaerolineae bacterium]
MRRTNRCIFSVLLVAGLVLALPTQQAVAATGDDVVLTDFSPGRNVMNAPLDSSITLTYDQPIDASSVTGQTVVIHSNMRGVVPGAYSADGSVVTIDPDQNFFGGDVVYVIATNGVADTEGEHPASGTQWQFSANTYITRTMARFSEMYEDSSGVSGSGVWADFNNDGWLDFLVHGLDPSSAYSSELKLNNGDGTFTSAGNVISMPTTATVAPADYDNDGDLDLLMATMATLNPGILLYQNDGSGDFSVVSGTGLPTSVSMSGAAWGDYNNDGWLDVLITYQVFTPTAAVLSELYQNNGDGTFSLNSSAGITGAARGRMAWGDYDNDGWLDVVIQGTDLSGTALTTLWRNNADGTFTENTIAGFVAAFSGSLAWGDYDNDGWLDLLMTGQNGTVRHTVIYRNNQDGTFYDIAAGLTPTATGNAAWGDYDNDGDYDVILTGRDTNTSRVMKLYRNDDGTFIEVALDLVESSDGMAVWGDYDNDGDVDILRTGRGNTRPDSTYDRLAIIYRNDNYPLVQPADYPADFGAAADAGTITNTWTDALSDLYPDGYLLLCSTADSFTAPVDGTDPADDNQCADGSGVVHVDQSMESYTWSGLTALTPYYFTIYPYNNRGSDIDYKTDGTPPTANDTTGALAPTAVTTAASGVGVTRATLNGTVNANNDSTTVTFEYGLTIAYGSTATAVQSPLSGGSDSAVSVEITGLAYYTTYHYRVVAQNSTGTTYGEDMTFDTNPIGVPTLTSPADGASLSDLTPTFDWEDADGADSYVLQLSTDDSFTSPSEESVTTSTFTPAANLAAGEWFWRVKTVHAGAESGWSSVWSFTLSDLAAPDLLSPADDAAVYDTTPAFDWADVSGATGYILQISMDDSFTSPAEESVTGSSFTPASALAMGDWYWRVKTVRDTDESDWSAAWHFTLGPLPAPVLLSPAQSTAATDPLVTFQWNSVAEAELYTLEVKKVSDNSVVYKARFAHAVRCSGDTCSVTLAEALPRGLYKWHVVAWHACGERGIFSAWNTFTRRLPTPVLRSPGDAAVVYGGRPTFKWYPVSEATEYVLELLDGLDQQVGVWSVENGACGTYCEFRLPSAYDLAADYGSYQWRVRARADADAGDWSAPFAFTYQQLARTAQVSPADGFATSDPTPAFSWTDVTGATQYLFQLRDDSNAVVLERLVSDATYCDGSTCTWDLDQPLVAGNYQWHVRAKNGRNFGRWTAYRTITIDE